MRRTKQWWAALSPDERSMLVRLERDACHPMHASLDPDGYYECGHCSTPSCRGVNGLCLGCNMRLRELIEKADNSMPCWED